MISSASLECDSMIGHPDAVPQRVAHSQPGYLWPSIMPPRCRPLGSKCFWYHTRSWYNSLFTSLISPAPNADHMNVYRNLWTWSVFTQYIYTVDHVLQVIKLAPFPLLEFDSCLRSSKPTHFSRGTRGPRHLVGTTPSDERGYTTSCYDMLTRVGSWSQDHLQTYRKYAKCSLSEVS